MINKRKILDNAKRFGIVNEAPLPPSWDKSVFAKKETGRINYNKMVNYARERAETLGDGSSRAVFEVKYKGRPTALKIALNAKGKAQNKVESNPAMHKKFGGSLIVPIIDWDKKNSMPLWIHYEKAEPFDDVQFKKIVGVRFYDFYNLLVHTTNSGYGYGIGYMKRYMINKIKKTKIFNDTITLCKEFNIFPRDLDDRNWGIYKGNPVLIDIGLSEDVYDKYY